MENRRFGFKNVAAAEADPTRMRMATTLSLRKQKKEDQILKKRITQAEARQTQLAVATTAGTAEAAIDGAIDAPAAQNDDFSMNMADLLPILVAKVHSGDHTEALDGTQRFRRLISRSNDPPIDAVISTGVVPKFVEFLQCDMYPTLQFEAAWALTNIASGTSDQTRVVVEAGAVPFFVRLMASANDDVSEQAVWGIGNLSGDSPQIRDLVLECCAMEPILHILMNGTKLTILRNAMWALSNLCRGKNPYPSRHAILPAVPVIARLLQHQDREIVGDACWAVSYITDNDMTQDVIDAGCAPSLIQHLAYPHLAVKTPALRSIGNIVTGTDTQTQMIVNGGALQPLSLLLDDDKANLRKEACWAISNITAGTALQIEAVLVTANILSKLVRILRSDEFHVRKEAAWAVCNIIASKKVEHIIRIAEEGAISVLCDHLTCKDDILVHTMLGALSTVLEVGNMLVSAQRASAPGAANPFYPAFESVDAVSKLDELQNHPSEEIATLASQILYAYFGKYYGLDEDHGVPAIMGYGDQPPPPLPPSSSGSGGGFAYNF